jgi:hypothetical protein
MLTPMARLEALNPLPVHARAKLEKIIDAAMVEKRFRIVPAPRVELWFGRTNRESLGNRHAITSR